MQLFESRMEADQRQKQDDVRDSLVQQASSREKVLALMV